MNVPVKLHRIRNMVQYFIYASKKFSLPNLGQPINEHSLWPIVKRDYRESKCSGWQHKLLTMKWYEVGTISGEGNGNPLQYSCWENPRVGGAWWAAVYGIAQGQTWLKWLSSSSSRYHIRLPVVLLYLTKVIIEFCCSNFFCGQKAKENWLSFVDSKVSVSFGSM